jgi:hypothetical protein
MEDNIYQLLEKLSIKAPTAGKGNDNPAYSAFLTELNETKFTIFVPLSDYGYFGRKPIGANSKSLSSVQSSNEIMQQIALNRTPPTLVSISQLRLPHRFHSHLPAQQYSSLYPYGQYHIASLHVATQHRGVDLNEVDFVFGGSTLQMLAQQESSDPYMAVRVPTTKTTILVAKCKDYIQDFSDVGFQFERLVTGGSRDGTAGDVEFVEHMHAMLIGDVYKVLFCAEADAVDEMGNPIEVKSSNPRYWGTKTLFQMISNACPTLCHGMKGRNELSSVTIRRLSSVADDALRDTNYIRLQDNILKSMKALKEEMMVKEVGNVYSIDFDKNGKLQLFPTTPTRSSTLFPPSKVVKELLLRSE